MFKQGRNLAAGDRINLVSGEAGIATTDQAQRNYLVSNEKDKKGNAKIIDLNSGAVAAASPLSVWNVYDVPNAGSNVVSASSPSAW